MLNRVYIFRSSFSEAIEFFGMMLASILLTFGSLFLLHHAIYEFHTYINNMRDCRAVYDRCVSGNEDSSHNLIMDEIVRAILIFFGIFFVCISIIADWIILIMIHERYMPIIITTVNTNFKYIVVIFAVIAYICYNNFNYIVWAAFNN